MTFKKIPNGDYYYFNVHGNTVMIIKATDDNAGYILNNLRCPSELVGKRVRIKLEMVEDGNK